jgi:type VI secretion system protein ImpA
MTLLEHQRLGRYSCNDFERFHKEGAGADNYGMFRALLDATSEEDLRAVLDRLEGLENAIRRVDGVMTANADGDTATNFAPTYEALGRYRAAVASFVPGMDSAPAGDDGSQPAYGSAPSASAGYAAAPSGPGFSGGIASRDDVIRALDAIDAYYARHEPSSPVPFALRRARQWISLDFMAVLEDIAPGSLDEASRVLKSGRESSGGWDSGGDSGSSSSSSDDSGW